MTLSAISRIGRISRPWSSEKILPPRKWWKINVSPEKGPPQKAGSLHVIVAGGTLPETNGSPPKIGHPKRKLIFQPSIFRGELLVSGRVYTYSLPIQLLLNLQRLHYILHLSTAFKRRAVWGNLISEVSPQTSPRRNMPRKQPALSSWGKISGGKWLNICLLVGGFNPFFFSFPCVREDSSHAMHLWQCRPKFEQNLDPSQIRTLAVHGSLYRHGSRTQDHPRAHQHRG